MMRSIYRNGLKRVFDLLFSFVFLLLLSPLLLLVVLAIKLDSAGPVFFRQERVSRGLGTFTLFKFRSMYNVQHEVRKIEGRDEGVTPVGYLLRRTKLDEVPQMFNVIRGDMSLIGPRPGMPSVLDEMSEREKQRYTVRPGLTGWAQVNGNIHIPWKERYVYDLEYVENLSLFMDLRIALKTVIVIFKGEKQFVSSDKHQIK